MGVGTVAGPDDVVGTAVVVGATMVEEVLGGGKMAATLVSDTVPSSHTLSPGFTYWSVHQ
jgi:hypothetical protein